MIKIENGIPIPDISNKQKKYPWIDMKIGDSFFIPESDKKSNFHSHCRHANKIYGKVFKARKVDGGMRVWRVE